MRLPSELGDGQRLRPIVRLMRLVLARGHAFRFSAVPFALCYLQVVQRKIRG
jgi:hypothetical protein